MSVVKRFLLIPLMVVLLAVPGFAAQHPERVVAAYLDRQPADFIVLPEEVQLLTAAVNTLIHQGSAPGGRRQVMKALQGLENGDAGPASEVLLNWQREGVLTQPGQAKQVAVVVGLGDIDRVHSAFRKAMNEDSGNPDTWFLLGHALLRAGKDELSTLAFNQVQLLSDLSGDPLWGARAGVRLGIVYTRQGDYREARAQLLDAVGVLTDTPYAHEAAVALDQLSVLHIIQARENLEKAARLYELNNNVPKADHAQRRADQLGDMLGN